MRSEQSRSGQEQSLCVRDLELLALLPSTYLRNYASETNEPCTEDLCLDQPLDIGSTGVLNLLTRHETLIGLLEQAVGGSGHPAPVNPVPDLTQYIAQLCGRTIAVYEALEEKRIQCQEQRNDQSKPVVGKDQTCKLCTYTGLALLVVAAISGLVFFS